MKTALRFSLLANLFLAGTVLWLVSRKDLGLVRQDPMSELSVEDDGSVTTAPPEGSSQGAAPFHWSQLESTDYGTYVANLRAIGCPEQTVRDIITADLHSQLQGRDQNWNQQRRPCWQLPAGFGGWAQSQVRAIGQTEEQEAMMVEALLAPKRAEDLPPVTQVAPGSQAAIAGGTLPTRQPSLPLVFQEVDPNKIAITDAQGQIINELRERFSADITSSNFDPGDPAYRRRWLSAQFISDCTMRGMFGREFFLNYQLAALNKEPAP